MKLFDRVSWSFCLLVTTLGFSKLSPAAQPSVTRLPLNFEQNRGQAPEDVRYLIRGGAFEGEFLEDGVRLRLRSGQKNFAQIKMQLINAKGDAGIAGDGTLEGHTNYLLGSDSTHWLRGLPNYSQVKYHQIYPGTDLVFYGNDGVLEHDFEVQPGANPTRIAFRLDGAKSLALAGNGDLLVSLAAGEINLKRPVAYQTVAGVRHEVEAAFTLAEDGTVRFRMGNYDRAEKLVIDPVLTFATYLSPLASDANLVATDAGGNNYVSGYAAFGFPVTSGAFEGCASCTSDTTVTYISKLSADGKSLLYSTVLGGNGFAQPTGISVDANGNVLVSGFTGATDFPTKNGQKIAPSNNATLGFLVSLSADGSSLNYGTLLGSAPSVSPAATTYATAVAFDSSGNGYVTGETGDGFFTTPGALNQAVTGNSSYNSFDVFLAKFSPTGTLIYSAVLGTADPQNGGGGPIGASAISVDAAGDAFVAGQAGTLWPISSNAYLKTIAGSMPYATPFVTKVAPDAKSLLYSTYLDYAYVVTGLASLSDGDVFVAGNGVGASYPTTSNAYQKNSGGGSAFLAKLNSSGSSLLYSTVIGDGTYKVNGLALDPDGDIWLASQTSNAQFPLVDPIQATFPISDGFQEPVSVLNQFDPTGQTMKFSTFLGGDVVGWASSVAIDANHKAHVSGAAQYGMYTTPGVYDGSVPSPGPGYNGAIYGYVALIDPVQASATVCLDGTASAGLFFGYLLPQSSTSQNLQISNCGSAPLTFTSITTNNAAFTVPAANDTCTGSLAVGKSCMVSVTFTPTAAQTYSGLLTIESNATIATTSIPLNGNGAEPAASFEFTSTFEPLLVGQTSPPSYFVLENSGQVALTINLAQVTVTGDFALAQGGNCPASLPAGGTCNFLVTFAPKTAGTIAGLLSVPTSDPSHPTLTTPLSGTAFASYPIATITALLNPSYPINSGTTPIAMSVLGTNFFPASVVYINGAAQTTKYQSSTFLNVTFDPSLLNAVGQIPVTVVNPTPGGGISAAYPLIGYLAIPLTASALTIDPVGGLLYAAIPGSASQNPNTILPINPATGAMLTPIAVASNPRALAVSNDGSELFVASDGALQRINLKTQAIEKTFPLPVDSEWGQTYVEEMHVVPGSPKSIMVELFANVDPAEDGAALYNDAGLVNWIPGQGLVNGANTLFWLDSFTFTSSPTVAYGLPEGFNSSFFMEIPVSPTGISRPSSGSPGETNQQTGSIVRSDGKLLYTNAGQVWDPSSQKLLGTYLGADGNQLFYAPSVVPDAASKHTYFLDGSGQYSQYQALSIDVYDQASYALLGTIPFLNIYSPDAVDLVRWGSKGFAFRTVDITGSDASANQIVIVTSDLVNSNGAAPIPILTSVSPSKVNAGGAAYSMQLTGSGFTIASMALVNGTPRDTTYVSGTSLTAQVLASDIATAGQMNVQVTTPAPGGGTSNYVYVLIEQPVTTTPTVALTPSATAITTAQALTVQVAVSGGNSKGTPTGSVTLTGGGYTSSTLPLTNGAATITIPSGMLAAGTDTLTVAYTPDTSSATTYSGATGSTSVTVTAVSKIASTITAVPAVSVLTNAQTDAVSITVAGVSGQATPTGMVTLANGSYSGNTTVANGAASIIIPAGVLNNGANTITATYSGDGLYTGSSITFSVTVVQVLISGPTPAAVLPGSTATTSMSLSAGNNYAGTMHVSCSLSASPAGAQSLPTCSLNPASVAITAGGNATTVLSVQTTAMSSNALLSPTLMKGLGLGSSGTILAGLILFGIPARRRRWMAMMVFLLVVLAAGVSGCGGGGSSKSPGNPSTPATTPGTYQFTVTGTDSANASITASTSVTVTVQ